VRVGYVHTKRKETPNTSFETYESQSLGAKVQGREGNSPDRSPRPYKGFIVRKGSGYRDSQEVGLEAAILGRSRNSAMAEWRPGPDNGEGLLDPLPQRRVICCCKNGSFFLVYPPFGEGYNFKQFLFINKLR